MQFLQDMRKEQNERADRLEREVRQQYEQHRQFEAAMLSRHESLEKALQDRHTALEQRMASDREAAEARDAEFEKRLQALEARKPQVAPPPLQFPPAWQPDGSTAAGSSRHPSARSGLNERWIPTCGFLRGWSPYAANFQDRKGGISRQEADDLMTKIRACSRGSLWNVVLRHTASSLRNFQIVLHLSPDAHESDLYEFARTLNLALKTEPIKLNDLQVYFSLDQPLWRKQRNQRLRMLCEVLKNKNPALEVHIEWGPGFLWHKSLGSEPLLLYTSGKNEIDGTFIDAVLSRWELTAKEVEDLYEARAR
jgi:hypothetical protein